MYIVEALSSSTFKGQVPYDPPQHRLNDILSISRSSPIKDTTPTFMSESTLSPTTLSATHEEYECETLGLCRRCPASFRGRRYVYLRRRSRLGQALPAQSGLSSSIYSCSELGGRCRRKRAGHLLASTQAAYVPPDCEEGSATCRPPATCSPVPQGWRACTPDIQAVLRTERCGSARPCTYFRGA